MCSVTLADIGPASALLDERRFALVVSSALPEAERLGAAREVFSEAGACQPDEGAACICGLPVWMPEPHERPAPSAARRRSVAALVWAFGTLLYLVVHHLTHVIAWLR